MTHRSDFERELKRIGLPRPRREMDDRILEPRVDREERDSLGSDRPALLRFGVAATLAGMAALVLISVLQLIFAGARDPEPDGHAVRSPAEESVPQEEPVVIEKRAPVIDDPVVIDLCQGASADGFLDAKLARDVMRALAALRRVDPDLTRVQRDLVHAYRFRDARRLGLKLPDAAAAQVTTAVRAAHETRSDAPAARSRAVPATGLAPLDALNRRYGAVELRPCPPYAGCFEIRFAGARDTWKLARIYQDALGPVAPGTHAVPVFRSPPDDAPDRRRGRYLVAFTRRGGQLDFEFWCEDRPGEIRVRRFAYHPATNQVSRVGPGAAPKPRRMEAVMLTVDWNRTAPAGALRFTVRAMDEALARLLEQRPEFGGFRPLPSIGFPPVSAAFAPPRSVALSSHDGRIDFHFRDLDLKTQTTVESPLRRR